jgi:ferredoxin
MLHSISINHPTFAAFLKKKDTMKRTVIKIDESLCNGCGNCVSGCHEGALQLIDGKARMVSELYCDGLGACIGDCPVGAIELEEREAEPYSETAVMERITPKGEETIVAHLLHLKDHNELELFEQGIQYLEEHNITIDMNKLTHNEAQACHTHGSGCPGSKPMSFAPVNHSAAPAGVVASQLRQWPVQLHLLNPQAGYFQNADVLLAADCAAFACGDFHNRFIKNHVVAIACPKLDSGTDSYVEKMKAMIEQSNINTLTVVVMEVPCCGGLLHLAKQAVEQSSRKVPVKMVVISVQGEVLEERWV